MISCCEIALMLGLTNVISLAIFAGYTIKLRERQFILEHKNGKEQKQLDELKEKITRLEKNNHESN